MLSRRKYMVMSLILIISMISVGYASLSTTLNVNGTSNIRSANWNIHFSNIQVKEGSTTPTTPATIKNDTSVEFNITLSNIGNFYEFSVDIVNSGTLDAMLSSIVKTPTLTSDQEKYLEYDTTYIDGTPININDSLASGKRLPIRIRVKYKDGITARDIPTNESIINIKYELQYKQANGDESQIVLGETAEKLINKSNGLSITSYATGNTHQMYAFKHEQTDQVPIAVDYRYIGGDPYNYIVFNNELWRIIGVFDGKIKIIRNESIGSYALNPTDDSINYGYGIAEWSKSFMMKLLNQDAYFNKTTGQCYANYEYTPFTCDFSTIGLTDTAKNQIEDTKYYTGGLKDWKDLSGPMFYKGERSNNKYENPPDGVTRTTNWTGKIGLLYPSDYTYTYALGIDNTCFNTTSSCVGDTAKSWLFKNDSILWTITPRINEPFLGFGVVNNGTLMNDTMNGSHDIKPTAFLKTGTSLFGTGTKNDPYTINE